MLGKRDSFKYSVFICCWVGLVWSQWQWEDKRLRAHFIYKEKTLFTVKGVKPWSKSPGISPMEILRILWVEFSTEWLNQVIWGCSSQPE